MKFSIKDFFSKCDQILRKLRIWSHLLKKFLTENFIFSAVKCISTFYLGLTNQTGNHRGVNLERETERDRQRETERDRDKETETERQRDRQTERQRDTERQRERDTH